MTSLDPALVSQLAVAVVSLYTLVTAAERAIDRLLALARSYDLPETVVGMTVVAVGTSLPELASHLSASLGIISGVLDYGVTSAVVVGGSIGSATTQQLLLVGLLAVGVGRVEFTDTFLRTSYVPMLLALGATLLVSIDGTVSRPEGIALLAGYVAYAYYGLTRRGPTGPALLEPPSGNARRDALLAGAMLALVLASASVLLSVVEPLVASLRFGGSMVGVLTLGVAAALPELSTVLAAIRRRTPGIALGTLVGSNVVNTLLGVGGGAALSTYAVPRAVVVYDLPFKLAVGVGLLIAVRYGPEPALTRRAGTYLVALYVVYVVGRLLAFPGG